VVEGMREKSPVAGMGKILLMDDEESVRGVAGEMLKAVGYECELAKDGAEAVELYRRAQDDGRPFDAAIMDLTVPGGMGGREAVKKLIELDHRVKVIVASGYSNDPVMADFKAYGFSGVITKPYDIATLSRTLRTVLA
jgi:two-component system cell cycle sensor histidine kinase/response regulator CckA